MKRFVSLLVAVLVVSLMPGSAVAKDGETRAKAKAALEKYQDALVTVKLVLKTRTIIDGKEGSPSEEQIEMIGTVLNSNGLTLVSDFSSNPSALFQSTGENFKVETETSDVKLILKDGKELAAKFVLRDRDLDLAFVMPTEKIKDLVHVKLEKGEIPAVMDHLIFVYRMGKSLNREAGVAIGRLEGIVKKPRTFLVPDLLNGLHALGCAAFDASGRPIGVVVVRRSPGGSKGMSSVRDILEMVKPVILATEDIQAAIDQIGKEEKP